MMLTLDLVVQISTDSGERQQVVLRTIRGGDEGAFVPSLAVLGGLVLAFVGIAFLIYFIHHISLSIQASSIIAAVAQETMAAVDHLFPKGLADNADEDADGNLASALGEQTWSVVGAREMGYIESIDGDALLALARKHRTTVRMERGIGEFVVEGIPLVSVAGPGRSDEETAAELNDVYVISRQMTKYPVGGMTFDVESAIGRLSDRITRVEVHLSDQNGDKSGQEDKRCMLEARLEGRQPTVVTHEAASLDEAVDGAAGKLKRSLESTFERLEDARRT